MKNKLNKVLISFFLIVTIFGCKKEETTTPIILNSTSLELTIVNNLGNPIQGANVKLYNNFDDWNVGVNQIGSTLTSDFMGKVKFSNLMPLKYFWYAEYDCQNNVNGAVTTTQPLTANINNTLNIVLSGTGNVVLNNISSNPYSVYLNGTYAFDMNGGTSKNLNYLPIGNFTIRVLQLSGYILYPTDKTYNLNIDCGNTITTNFPN